MTKFTVELDLAEGELAGQVLATLHQNALQRVMDAHTNNTTDPDTLASLRKDAKLTEQLFRSYKRLNDVA